VKGEISSFFSLASFFFIFIFFVSPSFLPFSGDAPFEFLTYQL
jgi:hypothetical protein